LREPSYSLERIAVNHLFSEDAQCVRLRVATIETIPVMEQAIIELDFPEGVIRFPFEKKEEPRPLWSIARDLLPIGDLLAETGSTIARSFNHAVSCGKGCGVCCRQMVPLSPPEAAIIAEVVDHLPHQQKESVLFSFAYALENLEAAGIGEKISAVYSIRTDAEVIMEVNRAYFRLSIPCPFLVDGACSIYSQRPSRCREYSVLSPAEYCNDPFSRQVRRLPLTIKLCESLSFAWSSLVNRPPLIIPLIKSLEWVRDNEYIRELSIYGAEQFARTVLGYACEKANRIAREKMEHGGKE